MIPKQIQKKLNAFLDEIKNEVHFEIEKHYEKYIQEFYDNYTPDFYERTFSTYEASDSIDSVYTSTKKGDRIGIIVSSEHMPLNCYHWKNYDPLKADGMSLTEHIFTNTFEHGGHGFETYDKVSPQIKMDSWFNNFTKNRRSKYTPRIMKDICDKDWSKAFLS